MKIHVVLGMFLAVFCPAAVLAAKDIHIKATDNIGGGSQAAVITGPGTIAEIEAASQSGDCRLQDFMVSSGLDAKPRSDQEQVKTADEIRGSKVVLHLYAPGDWTVRARYVHTVLLEEGQRTEPEKNTETTGEGDIDVGRTLANGYQYDHVDFASHVNGPGGASALVEKAPYPGSPQAIIKIRWYDDPYSSVHFSWKIYVKGPCDASP